jgi:serine/threonine protein kinase
MSYAFQDRENLYLIMDYLDGGDLRYHIGKKGKFTEAESKFFIANLIIGLEYMHNNNVIHRDIKPENLVLDKDGYLRITDMGISR